MDNLDEVAQVSPVSIDDFIEERPLAPLAPDATIRNRAAILALQSDKPIENYQALYQEGTEGRSDLYSMLKGQNDVKEDLLSQQALMTILADPSTTPEMAQKAIDNINKGMSKDSGRRLALDAALEASEGYSPNKEDARIHAVEIFDEIHQYAKDKQAILNEHGMMLNQDNVRTLSELVEGVLPFANNKLSYSVLKDISKELNLGIGGAKAALLPGEAKVAIREAISNMPPNQQVEAFKKIRSVLENNSTIFFRDDNDFAEYMLVNDLLAEEGYGTMSRVFDNASGLLDLIGLGVVRTAGKVFKSFKRTPEAMESNVATRSVSNNTSPVAPANLIKDTNPDRAKKMLQAVDEAKSDELSKALFGVSRDEAIISNTLPQPASIDGTVESRIINPNPEVLNTIKGFGGEWLTTGEKSRAVNYIEEALKEVKGVTYHDNMSQGGLSGINYKGKAVYGLEGSGFSNAEDALNQTKFALSEFGIVEDNIQILKKIDGEYVPVKREEVAGLDGDYLAAVEINRDIKASDIGSFDVLDVKRNLFDSVPAFRSKKSGTMANTLLDNASMLHPKITGGGVVQTDKGVLIDKLFLDEFDAFAVPFRSLKSERQDKLYEYIKLANKDGLDEDVLSLTARGFTSEEVNILNKWRSAWDTQWFFENRDLIKTVDAQGYKLFDHSNARLIGKPIQKDLNINLAYDADTDKLVKLSAQDIENLYNNGGTLSKLRRSEYLDNAWVDHFIVKNQPNNYMRALNASDEVLTYRKGYYQVHYDAPQFIVQVVKDGQGNKLFEKAVDIAGTTKEAEHIRDGLSKATGEEFYVRGDVKKFAPDTDYYWDLQSASGRLAQRRRGTPLQDSTVPRGFSETYMVDPVEGAIRSARSLAGRLASRDYLEHTKARALQQFGDVFPESQFGKPQWTENSNSLVARGRMTGKHIRDARTTVEYINYLQRGYENAFDEGFKGLMNTLANVMARFSSKGEKLFMSAADIGPTDLGKNVVFQAYIATNPHRQWIVQTHGVMRILGYNPSYAISGLPRDVHTYILSKMLPDNKLTPQMRELRDFVDGSGMLQAVDRHNMVRGALTDMAESHKPIQRIFGKSLAVPRKIGFDIAEQTNVTNHILAVRDKFLKEGLDVTKPEVKDQIYSQARAIMGDMNFAGDMPYNQNAMAILMQFAQYPHKAITSITTNRRIRGTINPLNKELYSTPISKNDKLRLAAIDTLLFGVPFSVAVSNMIGEDMLPENPVAREAVLYGVESAIINKALSNIAGRDINLDVGSLSPYNMEGFAQMSEAFLDGGFWEMLSHSPASNVFFKDGSKVQEAIGRLIRYGGHFDPERPEDLQSILSGFAEISSGWSNYLKAKAIWETGNITTKSGQVIRSDAGGMEAMAKAFGFATQEEAYTYYMRNKLSENSKAYEDEVKRWTKSYVSYLTRQEKFTNQDPEVFIKTLGAARRVWGGSIKAQEVINRELGYLAKDIKSSLINDMLKASSLPQGKQSLVEMKNSGVLNDDEFDRAVRLIEDINKLQDEEDDN